MLRLETRPGGTGDLFAPSVARAHLRRLLPSFATAMNVVRSRAGDVKLDRSSWEVSIKGKDGKKESYRVDPGLMALLAELRAAERQAAEELGQWITKSEPSHLNVHEMTARLNAGRRRMREDREKRQALSLEKQTAA